MKYKLLLETDHCLGHGCSCYINNSDWENPVVKFLKDFCMWGGATKIYGKSNQWEFYELPEDTVTFMTSESFSWFCARNQMELIINPDKDQLSEVFKNMSH